MPSKAQSDLMKTTKEPAKKLLKAFAKGGRVSGLTKKGFPLGAARQMDSCGKKG
jgi:hypothetical protein